MHITCMYVLVQLYNNITYIHAQNMHTQTHKITQKGLGHFVANSHDMRDGFLVFPEMSCMLTELDIKRLRGHADDWGSPLPRDLVFEAPQFRVKTWKSRCEACLVRGNHIHTMHPNSCEQAWISKHAHVDNASDKARHQRQARKHTSTEANLPRNLT